MDCNFTLCKRYLNGNCIKQVGEKCQLEQAKEIIKQFLNDYPVITKELLDKLELFIKEIEK